MSTTKVISKSLSIINFSTYSVFNPEYVVFFFIPFDIFIIFILQNNCNPPKLINIQSIVNVLTIHKYTKFLHFYKIKL